MIAMLRIARDIAGRFLAKGGESSTLTACFLVFFRCSQ
jgi:hypothetical protein